MGLPHLRDVSNWQGPIHWQTEKREVAGLYQKVSQGMGYTDPTAKLRFRNALRNRVPAGGYHYAIPGSGSPESQADRLIALSPKLPHLRLRPCVDCEDNTLRLQPPQLAAWYLGFVIRVHRRLGYWPVVYGSPSYLQAFATYHPEAFGRCPLWVAHYGVKHPTIPAPWHSAAAWQWTDAFKDPAVGLVDDSFVLDLPRLRIPLTVKTTAKAVRR